MENEAIIAEILDTDYGREELRRAIINGLQNAIKSKDVKKSILAQSALGKNIFGEIPQKWESNPFAWKL